MVAEKQAPEPETAYPVAELVSRAQKALGVSSEAAAGALSGVRGPLTLTEAKKQVTAWLSREVR